MSTEFQHGLPRKGRADGQLMGSISLHQAAVLLRHAQDERQTVKRLMGYYAELFLRKFTSVSAITGFIPPTSCYNMTWINPWGAHPIA